MECFCLPRTCPTFSREIYTLRERKSKYAMQGSSISHDALFTLLQWLNTTQLSDYNKALIKKCWPSLSIFKCSCIDNCIWYTRCSLSQITLRSTFKANCKSHPTMTYDLVKMHKCVGEPKRKPCNWPTWSRRRLQAVKVGCWDCVAFTLTHQIPQFGKGVV